MKQTNFIGRKEQLDEMSLFWLNNDNPVLALTGLPHSGKSALLKVFLNNNPYYDDFKCHPIFTIDLGPAQQKTGYEIVRHNFILDSYKHLQENNPEVISNELREIVKVIENLPDLSGIDTPQIGELNRLTPKYFALLNKCGIIPTYVIDRFERAWYIIATELFSIFRQLVKAWNIRMILITTRPINSVVAEADKVNVGEVSSFPSQVKSIYVGALNEQETKLLISSLWQEIKGVSSVEKSQISNFVNNLSGGFPYLINRVFNLMEAMSVTSQKINLRNIQDKVDANSFYNELLKNLDNLIFSRNEEKLANGHSRITNTLNNLAITGWNLDLKDDMESVLLNYGVLKTNTDIEDSPLPYRIFSTSFGLWLSSQITPVVDNAIDIVQEKLRILCEDYLKSDAYQNDFHNPENWIEYFIKDYLYCHYKDEDEILVKRIKDMSKRYNQNVSKYDGGNILEAAYLADYRFLFFNIGWEDYFQHAFIRKYDNNQSFFRDKEDFDCQFKEMETFRNDISHKSSSKARYFADNKDLQERVIATCMVISNLIDRFFA